MAAFIRLGTTFINLAQVCLIEDVPDAGVLVYYAGRPDTQEPTIFLQEAAAALRWYLSCYLPITDLAAVYAAHGAATTPAGEAR